jgi:hypothetical protein
MAAKSSVPRDKIRGGLVTATASFGTRNGRCVVTARIGDGLRSKWLGFEGAMVLGGFRLVDPSYVCLQQLKGKHHDVRKLETQEKSTRNADSNPTPHTQPLRLKSSKKNVGGVGPHAQ